ncbi:hypothetical protein FLJC2902T_17370 [Flavobacterium limnosediminis JC2902]|uniref:Uncharacterized protein n=1 Tax=Flavobacterium limnosediminis JC2902 TaxID=1341181 RepID=V6SPL1_9FLAO|nr:hypothetical protein [Flavobacterium limnosediminis]ESU28384.1 hypothetical protein FLJC2902T_17370 [Flavobacterium limnosediminis JC2902]
MDIKFKKYDGKMDLRAGMIVKKDNGEVELVGHININEGDCSCCTFGSIVEYNDDTCNQLEEIINNIKKVDNLNQ